MPTFGAGSRGPSARTWVWILGIAVVGTLIVRYHGTVNADSAPGAKIKVHASSDLGLLNHVRTANPTGTPSQAGYDRIKNFGPAWADVNHNHCDTRDDMLARDLTSVKRSGACEVTSGTLADPYTGKTIHFVRGVKTSTKVQIDHIVPLGWVWLHGAKGWSATQRESYANDPMVLLSVDGPSNEKKSDDGPAKWMPSNSKYQCVYAADWVRILSKYHLTIDTPDRTKLTGILHGC